MKTWKTLCLTATALFLSSGVALPQTTSLDAQKAVVVKLQVHFAKHGDEIAAGLFVGKDQQYAYFITARHAIVDDTGAQPVAAKSVKLQFSNGPQSFNASIFDQDPILDLGVVYLPLANLPPNLPEIIKMDAVANTPILIIGHPAAGDWSVWRGTVQNENAPNDVRRFITSTDASLAKGYSGGPEFDQSGSFVGMQIETEVTYGIATKGSEIMAQLKGWRVPTNNLIAKPIIITSTPHEGPQADIDAIKNVLSRFEDAYNHRDAKALWNIWPSVPTDRKQKIEVYFKSAASIRASLRQSMPELDVTGMKATVAAQFSQRFTPKQGNQQPEHNGEYVFTLRKNAGEWTIVEVK